MNEKNTPLPLVEGHIGKNSSVSEAVSEVRGYNADFFWSGPANLNILIRRPANKEKSMPIYWGYGLN